jgi:hypothetical protein
MAGEKFTIGELTIENWEWKIIFVYVQITKFCTFATEIKSKKIELWHR